MSNQSPRRAYRATLTRRQYRAHLSLTPAQFLATIESELERRYPGSDQFEAFEKAGGDTENGSDYLAHWGEYWTAKMQEAGA
ncbi:hypothetical protein [Microbacterium sp. No. 7]|uniref:hypothetical protein n=1 Tax=Microbacterium sp. No. 7 TaxID=1714373 RepID=UPI000AD76B9B|nr:hypothetical protein [Microbacterium sp. No. 7]